MLDKADVFQIAFLQLAKRCGLCSAGAEFYNAGTAPVCKPARDRSDLRGKSGRVGVKSGGCSGLSYDLKFDKEHQEDDKLFEDNGVKIIVDKKSFLYLVGTTLEFSDGLNGKGFVFNNPNANRTCGCGESFSL